MRTGTKLLLALAAASVLSTAGCAAGVSYRTPAYYEARGYPVRVIRPGMRAYYIVDGWYVYDAGRWTPYQRVAVRRAPTVIVR